VRVEGAEEPVDGRVLERLEVDLGRQVPLQELEDVRQLPVELVFVVDLLYVVLSLVLF
jgi:hypothetical protein